MKHKFIAGLFSIGFYAGAIYLLWGVDWEIMVGAAMVLAGAICAKVCND